jgi:hypothetical protein
MDSFELTVNNKGIINSVQEILQHNNPAYNKTLYAILQRESHWTTFTVRDVTQESISDIANAMALLLTLEEQVLGAAPDEQNTLSMLTHSSSQPIPVTTASTFTLPTCTPLNTLQVDKLQEIERLNIVFQLLYMAKIQQDQGWHFINLHSDDISQSIFLSRQFNQADKSHFETIGLGLLPLIGVVCVYNSCTRDANACIRAVDSFYSPTQIQALSDGRKRIDISNYSPDTRWKAWALQILEMCARTNIAERSWLAKLKDIVLANNDVKTWWQSSVVLYTLLSSKKK